MQSPSQNENLINLEIDKINIMKYERRRKSCLGYFQIELLAVNVGDEKRLAGSLSSSQCWSISSGQLNLISVTSQEKHERKFLCSLGYNCTKSV